MKLVNKLFTRTNKILIAFIMIFVLLQNIGMSKIMNIFLYYKNGSEYTMQNYIIKFPIGHWAYFGESKITYVIIGKNINVHNLSAEFFKDAEKLDITNAISNCDTIKKQGYKGKSIKGNIYLCMRNKTETMYFQSEDKKILIRENDYNSSNEKIVAEYQLLLNSISPRE